MMAISELKVPHVVDVFDDVVQERHAVCIRIHIHGRLTGATRHLQSPLDADGIWIDLCPETRI